MSMRLPVSKGVYVLVTTFTQWSGWLSRINFPSLEKQLSDEQCVAFKLNSHPETQKYDAIITMIYIYIFILKYNYILITIHKPYHYYCMHCITIREHPFITITSSCTSLTKLFTWITETYIYTHTYTHLSSTHTHIYLYIYTT